MSTASQPRQVVLQPRIVQTDGLGRLVGCTGTRDEFIMEQNEPLNTTKVLVPPTVSGTPTSKAVLEGSLLFDKASDQLFAFDGTTWIPASRPTWAQVLERGETSGNFTPTITDNQQLLYSGPIRIGGDGLSTAVVNAGGIGIGQAASAQNLGAVGVGNGAVAAGPDCAAFGTGATALPDRSTALGQGATTTANDQVRLGVASDTVSVPGALDVELDAAFHQAVVLDAMTAPGDLINRLTIPTVAADPTAAVADGSIAVQTTDDRLFFRSGGVWIDATATESWAETLLAGNTTGGTNPTVSSGDEVVFAAGVAISGNGDTTASIDVRGVGIGGFAQANGDRATGVGYDTIASFQYASAFGNDSQASAIAATALGHNTRAPFASSTAVGASATTTAINQVRLGTASETVSVPGALDVELDAAFHQAVVLDAMTAPGDTVNRLTIPTHTAPPTAAVADGSIMVETTANKFYFRSGGTWIGSGAGSVTSVALAAPAEFTVSGSPVTGAGTLTLTKATQAANLVWAGPSAGGPLAPAFRSLVAADLPAIAWSVVLADGNTTGNNTPTITNDQEILFNTGIRIGGGGGSSAAAAASAISIGPTLNAAGVTSIAVGNLAQSPNLNSIGIGNGARGLADNAVAVGTSARADGDNAVSLGRLTTAYAPGSAALGYNANVPIAYTNSVQVGAGVATAANQIRLGGASYTVSVPGALVVDAMTAATDAGRRLQAPTFTADPMSAAADGSLMVQTTDDKLFYRSNGTWFGLAQPEAAGASATNQVIAAATLNVKLNLATSDFDTGGIVDLVNDWLSFGLNETWLVQAFVKGDDNGSNHSGNVTLLARIRWTNNVTTTTESEVEFPWAAGTNTTFASALSAIIRTGGTGVQRVFVEFDNTTAAGANNDIRVLTLQFRAARFS